MRRAVIAVTLALLALAACSSGGGGATTTAVLAPNGEALTTEGTTFGPPSTPEDRLWDPDRPCDYIQGGETETCTAAGAYVALIESNPSVGRWARIFKGGDQFATMVLEAFDGEQLYSAMTAGATDLDGDGADELLIGFRVEGTGGYLNIDIVSKGEVVANIRELAQGSARFEPGRLQTWSAEYAPDDATCCPSAVLHQIVEFADGAYRVVASESLPPDASEPSML